MTTDIDLAGALDEVLGAETNDAESESETAKPEPYIDALPVTQLFADHSYQRELDEFRVQKMAANFTIALVGIIEVSARADGRYAILDGQHRWATVRDVDFARATVRHLACRVHTDLTVVDEAALYHQLNTTRKQLTGWDRWVARRRAGEELVLDIEACADRHDFTVNMREAPGVIRATKACENVVALGGVGLLDQVLDVVRAAYGDDQAGLDAAILHGLGHVLHAYDRDDLDLVRLVEAMSGSVPRQITARADAVREIHKGTRDRLVAHVIVERYNATKGRKAPAFFDRVKPQTKANKDATGRRNAAIREWAERQGLMNAGASGRIRKDVVAAYEAAHPSAPTTDREDVAS